MFDSVAKIEDAIDLVPKDDSEELIEYLSEEFLPSIIDSSFTSFEQSYEFAKTMALSQAFDSERIFVWVYRVFWERLTKSPMVLIFAFDGSNFFRENVFGWLYSQISNIYEEDPDREPMSLKDMGEDLVSMLHQLAGFKNTNLYDHSLQYSGDLQRLFPNHWYEEKSMDQCVFMSRLLRELSRYLERSGRQPNAISETSEVNPLEVLL